MGCDIRFEMPDSDGTAAHFTDAEIDAVIDHYDDPDHPDALSVAEVRSRLDTLQTTLEADWSAHLDAGRNGDLDVVRDTGAVVVFRDGDRTAWNRLLDDCDWYDSVDRTILRVVHHQAATRLTDHGFEESDPIVAAKPANAEAGQRFVEALINRLLDAGLLPNEAWAYYGIEVRGYDGREWADRCGYADRIAVADAVETARDKLGE